MDSVPIQGQVDEQHRLSAIVPGSVPPGPVTVWIAPTRQEEDDAGNAWSEGVARQWTDDLADPNQDIYSLDDGEPVDPS
jgi:hypothetical protein